MVKLIRPLYLLLAALTYALGASISAYLGKPTHLLAFVLGLMIVLSAQASMSLLSEAFRPHNEPLLVGETPQQKEALRANLIYTSLAFFAFAIFLMCWLHTSKILSIPAIVFFSLSFLLALAYSVPPARLQNVGLGELTLAAQLAYIIPSIGFSLQFKESHNLLVFTFLPLTALALAYFLILNFTTYESDQKYQRATLLLQLTWERAVPLHHSLIIFAYATLAFELIFGFSVLWTALLTLPFAVLQIFLLRHISQGGKPNWKLLNAAALAVFGLTAYFLTLSFWLR